jgi:hypothetical protein
MSNRYRVAFAVLSALILSACATPTKMALHDDSESIEKSEKPIFLMTATLKNGYRESYQPELLVVNIERKEVTGSSDRINFTMDDKAKKNSDSDKAGNSYFLRMALDSGSYVVRGMTGFSGIFPVRGMFFAPVHTDLQAPKSGVYYLGHIDATVRERNENEFRAGPVIPLLDQAVTGFSGGTFEIAVTDRFEQDAPEFMAKFPALKNVQITKALLPAFDREKAQKWWDAH